MSSITFIKPAATGLLQSNINTVSTNLFNSGASLIILNSSTSGNLNSKIAATGESLYNRVSNLDNVPNHLQQPSDPTKALLEGKADVAPQIIYLSGSNTLNLNTEYWDYLDSDRAYVINGSPTGGEFISIYLINTGEDRFISLPSNFRLTESETITGLTIPMGRQELYLKRYPTEWSLGDTVGEAIEIHAISHSITGSDPITITQNQVTNLVADLATLAPISGGALTGIYNAPTPVVGDNSNQIATTAFVANEGYAKLDSPEFINIPKVPTATIGTNSTQAASTAFVHKAKTSLEINYQIGTTYTLVSGDAGKLIDHTNASNILTTIPANATAPFENGACILYSQGGAGKVTFTGAAGVTLQSENDLFSIGGRYVTVVLTQFGTDVWRIQGKLIA